MKEEKEKQMAMRAAAEQGVFGLPVGSDREFERLYLRLYGRLCAFSFVLLKDRALAEDVVQEAFLSLWNRRAEIRISSSVDGYIMRSVYNLCLMHITRTRPSAPLTELNAGASAPEPLPEGFSDEDARRLRLIGEAIDGLPEQCRRIFLLNKRDGLRQKEIAARLNLSLKTVDTQIFRAVKKIREYIRKQSE